MIRQPLTHLQLLLALALVFGGGGSTDGLRHMVLEWAALLLLALRPQQASRFLRQAPRGLVVLVALTMAWPLMQILPLPPALWQALPGRDLMVESYRVSGIAADSWAAFSLYPVRTLAAFCATLLPATVIVIGWSLPPVQRLQLALTVIALALALLLLGAVQLASANQVGLMQQFSADPHRLYATFANHNTTGMVFLFAALFTLALPWPRDPLRGLLVLCVAGLFVLAVILTQSRSAMALLAVVLAFAATRLIGHLRVQRRRMDQPPSRRPSLALVAGAAVVLAMLGAAVAASERASDAAARFATLELDRLEMWDDGAFVAKRYWPLGAGTGAFDDVFQVDESLEYVSPRTAGRAHNDYVELAIELGVPGLLLLAAWLAWLGLACRARAADPDRWLAYAALAGCCCLALQSVLDYPLRNHAILTLAGVLVVLLCPRQRGVA